MEKKIYILVGLTVLVFGFVFMGEYFTDWLENSQIPRCNRTDLVGALVKNSRGDVIGIVTSVADHGGQSYAILKHGSESYYGDGGRFTPVPIGALEIAESGTEQSDPLKTAFLYKREKRLEAAPFWDPSRMDDPSYEAAIDKHYRVHPVLCG